MERRNFLAGLFVSPFVASQFPIDSNEEIEITGDISGDYSHHRTGTCNGSGYLSDITGSPVFYTGYPEREI